MHNTNSKVVQAAISDNRSQNLATEINGNNIIFLRGAKTSDNGHILLRNDVLKTNFVLEDGDSKLSQVC